jgi:hypothetical protein
MKKLTLSRMTSAALGRHDPVQGESGFLESQTSWEWRCWRYECLVVSRCLPFGFMQRRGRKSAAFAVLRAEFLPVDVLLSGALVCERDNSLG